MKSANLEKKSSIPRVSQIFNLNRHSGCEAFPQCYFITDCWNFSNMVNRRAIVKVNYSLHTNSYIIVNCCPYNGVDSVVSVRQLKTCECEKLYVKRVEAVVRFGLITFTLFNISTRNSANILHLHSVKSIRKM